MAREDRAYEVPDPLAFQDYLARKDLFVRLAVERRATGDLLDWTVRPYYWFPYPKPVGGYRQMSVADPVDRAVYRTLAFQAGAVTDALLSERVFGNRLEKAGAWTTRLPTTAWRSFQNHQVASLERHDWPYTCISDISGFYPSIDINRLCTQLRRLGVPGTTVVPLQRLLSAWQTGKGRLTGLPVGGQGSGVLSNAYLLSFDALLQQLAVDFAMYGDDFAIFDPTPTHGRVVLKEVDAHFAGLLGLKRNVGKTKEFLSAQTAIDFITNHYRSYLAAIDDTDDGGPPEHLYDFWDDDVLNAEELDVSNVHFALGRLSRRHDPYAVTSLLDRLDILAADPKSTIGYITTTMPDDERTAERMCQLLAVPATPTTEALHLHACRYLSMAPHGAAVGTELERVLDSRTTFRGPTRAMAAQARIRCPGWRFDDALERADSEPEFIVRRSLVGATKTLSESPRTKRHALHSLCRRDRALIPTAAWADAA